MSNLKSVLTSEEIIQMCDKYDITAYEISKNTELTASGVKRILDGVVKKPHTETLEKIANYVIEKITSIEYNENLIKEPNAVYSKKETIEDKLDRILQNQSVILKRLK
jgi:predicted transcriptional regulator